MKLTIEHARRVLEVVDAGLVKGLGKPVPGGMCVEAAVNFALGFPHGDEPKCVGSAVRKFKIRLNDASWSSNAARTKGMRLLAIAQLGSDEINQREFAREVAFQTIKQILPLAFRAAGSMIPAHKDALEGAATACELVTDLAAALSAARAGREIAWQARADAAADAAAYAAADAYAAAAAAAAAYAAADAAAYAAADAAAYAARDKILTLAASIGLAALQKLKCKGCEWLGLAA